VREGSPVGRIVVGSLPLVGAMAPAPATSAAVSVSRAELSGTMLRIEGGAIAAHRHHGVSNPYPNQLVSRGRND
jgi:hypothetical protein